MWIKVCGIRDTATARSVAACGVDAIGLNFHPPSPRFVAVDVAREIVAGLPRAVEPVGLFVNHSAVEIRDIAAHCGLRTIQLHGDEPPEFLAELREFRLLRAFRVNHAGLVEMARYLERCQSLGCLPWGCLLDAKVEGAYGGTGHVAPWDLIARDYRRADWPPLILAGGLGPDNVQQGIAATAPWGVDVASGVETSPGVKDALRLRTFIHNARQPPLSHLA